MNAPDLAALRLLSRRDGALCTLVGIEGSFSRAIGAHLAIGWDGDMAGSLADGCLESELALQARALRGKGPQVMRYGRGSPVIDFRLPCGSGLDVLIDPAPDRAAIRGVLSSLTSRQPAAAAAAAGRFHAGCACRRLRLDLFGHGPEMEAWSGWPRRRASVPPDATSAAASRAAPGTVGARSLDGGGAAVSRSRLGNAGAGLGAGKPGLLHRRHWRGAYPPAPQRASGAALPRSAADAAARPGRADPGSTRDPATLALSILAEIMRDFEAAIRADESRLPS